MKQQEISAKTHEEKLQEIFRLEQRLQSVFSEQDFLREEIAMTEKKWNSKLEQTRESCMIKIVITQ